MYTVTTAPVALHAGVEPLDCLKLPATERRAMATSQPPALPPEVMSELGREWVFTALEEIGRSSIRKFALSIGDTHPLYYDDKYARESKYGGIIAPPTFVCETMQFMVGDLDETGGPAGRPKLPLGAEIRGSNEYTFHRPVRPEDVITARWKFANIRERDARTGKLFIVVSEITYTNQHDEVLAANSETSIFRVSESRQEDSGEVATAPQSSSGVVVGASARRLESSLCFEDVQVGDEITPLRKEITLPQMVFYAAATWDFHRYHYDQEFVREKGFPQPFVDGQNLGSFLAQMLVDWTGDPGVITKLGFRFRNFAFPGDVLTCKGSVTGKSDADGESLVECELAIEKQDGSMALAPGHATLKLPSRGRA